MHAVDPLKYCRVQTVTLNLHLDRLCHFGGHCLTRGSTPIAGQPFEMHLGNQVGDRLGPDHIKASTSERQPVFLRYFPTRQVVQWPVGAIMQANAGQE
jgi:hypothetical protein